MKKQEKLHVTLPSIPIAFYAFATPTMQDLSTYFIVVPIAISTPCLEDHPPFWLFLHENVVILFTSMFWSYNHFQSPKTSLQIP